jgi:hypothetical protein
VQYSQWGKAPWNFYNEALNLPGNGGYMFLLTAILPEEAIHYTYFKLAKGLERNFLGAQNKSIRKCYRFRGIRTASVSV